MRPGETAGGGATTLKTRAGSPKLAELEGLLGDFMVEDEVARTSQAVIYRIRAG